MIISYQIKKVLTIQFCILLKNNIKFPGLVVKYQMMLCFLKFLENIKQNPTIEIPRAFYTFTEKMPNCHCNQIKQKLRIQFQY